QLRIGRRVVGVRLELDRHADPSRSAVGHSILVAPLRFQVESRRFPCKRRRRKGRQDRRQEGRPARRQNPMSTSVRMADIEAARGTIAGHILRTPMLPAPKLSAVTGAEVYVKYENLQVTNSFKERGALNKLAALDELARARGVIAMSAGNHAQAVAYHAM